MFDTAQQTRDKTRTKREVLLDQIGWAIDTATYDGECRIKPIHIAQDVPDADVQDVVQTLRDLGYDVKFQSPLWRSERFLYISWDRR